MLAERAAPAAAAVAKKNRPTAGRKARVSFASTPTTEQWMRHFRCSARELALAVGAVGADPLDVGVYLERRC